MKCRATFCLRPMDEYDFVCYCHWWKLTKELRARLKKYFRPGHPDDENMSQEYIEAAVDAIRYLAAREDVSPDTSAFDKYLRPQ